jgi:hypothetical protein
MISSIYCVDEGMMIRPQQVVAVLSFIVAVTNDNKDFPIQDDLKNVLSSYVFCYLKVTPFFEIKVSFPPSFPEIV